MAKVFYKYLPLATTQAEQTAIAYMEDAIEGLDEDHVAHWASEHLTYDEVVNERHTNLRFFFKPSDTPSSLEAFAAGVVRFAAMYWLERGGIVFPSSLVVPKTKTKKLSVN